MIYDTIIIGGGCAGISSAIYALSRNTNTLIIEKENCLGGIINNISTISHFLGINCNETGETLVSRMEQQLSYYKPNIVHDTVLNLNLNDTIEITTENNTYRSKTLIIAAGTMQKNLEIADQNTHLNKFISHNAYSDARKIKDKKVIVVVGGDGAAKEALYLSTMAQEVTMIVLENQLIAIPEFQARISKTPNIKVLTNSTIKKINGNKTLESVEAFNSNEKISYALDVPDGMIFVYIGSTPNSDWCRNINNENGYLITDELMRTNIPGIFAVGDIRAKAIRQISTAVAEGTIAGIQVCNYLKTDRDKK